MNDIDRLRQLLANPQPVGELVIHRMRFVEVTAGELRAACDFCPDHPESPGYRKSVEGFADDEKICVERSKLESILAGNARYAASRTIDLQTDPPRSEIES